MDVKKKPLKEDRSDDKRKDENRRRRERDRKTSSKSKEYTTNKKDAKDTFKESKDNGGDGSTKEPRKRFRRRREEKRNALKAIDEKSNADRKDDLKSKTQSSSNTSRTEEPSIPRTTFTVKILTNDRKNVENDKTNEPKERRTVGEKVRNKDRPALQIYKPSPRSSNQTKDQSKENKKTSLDKPSSSNRF